MCSSQNISMNFNRCIALLFSFLRWINTAPLFWKMDARNVWPRDPSPTSKNLQISLSLLAQLEQNKQKNEEKNVFNFLWTLVASSYDDKNKNLEGSLILGILVFIIIAWNSKTKYTLILSFQICIIPFNSNLHHFPRQKDKKICRQRLPYLRVHT